MRAILERDFVHTASRALSFRSRTYIGVLVGMAVLAAIYLNYELFATAPDLVAKWSFQSGSVILLLLLVALTPPAVVGAVLAERQQSTLELVLASPVGATRYALAKVMARWSVAMPWVF
ncbi:MAG: hypothetical protein ACYTDX_11430, partial [Planctomycetota bacterium]